MRLKLYFPIMSDGAQLLVNCLKVFSLSHLAGELPAASFLILNPVLERGKGSELSVEQCPFFLFHEGFHFLGFSWEYWSTFSQLYYIPFSSIFPWKMAGFLHLSPGLSHFFQGKKMAMAMFLGSPPRWLMVLAIAPRAPECHGGKGCIHMALWKIWKNDDVLGLTWDSYIYQIKYKVYINIWHIFVLFICMHMLSRL